MKAKLFMHHASIRHIIPLMPGIPRWPAYNANAEYYMAIDRNWEVKVDYTQTYTVTVDELNPTTQ